MKTIVIASSNKNKIEQIKNMTSQLNINFKSAADFLAPEPIEDGVTYRENVLIKARSAFNHTGLASMADDSGFGLEALNGFPGVVSARFACACGNYENAFKILNECLEKNKRAFFCTEIAFVYKSNNKIIEKTFEGKIKGEFVYPAKGKNGFAYCPCFKPDGYAQTFGEMPDDLRMKINHRAIALNNFIHFLIKFDKIQ